MIDTAPLTSLLDDNRIGILDGGLATYLEDGLGFDLSKGPLWSARLLDEQDDDVSNGKGRTAIHDAHAHYLDAGAQVIGTATYQASRESFHRANYTSDRADQLMTHAVHIAASALSSSSSSPSTAVATPSPPKRAQISLSLGPYGAMLSNGAEYTGDYRPTHLAASDPAYGLQPTIADFRAFHHRRLQTFLRDEAAWSAIGVVAIETVPRADEGLAFRLAMEDLHSDLQLQPHKTPASPLRPFYVSFAFPDDRFLPWPVRSEGEGGEEQADAAMERMLYDLFSIEVVDGETRRPCRWPVSGIGINCTKPYLIQKLVDRMTRALHRLNRPEEQGGKALQDQRKAYGVEPPLLFLYPDGGLHYDAVNKVWIQSGSASSSTTAKDGSGTGPDSWASSLMAIAKSASAQSVWNGVFVGGCCKNGTEEIRALCRCR